MRPARHSTPAMDAIVAQQRAADAARSARHESAGASGAEGSAATAARRGSSVGCDAEAGAFPHDAAVASPASEDEGPASSLEALVPVAQLTASASWALNGAAEFGSSLLSSDGVRSIQSAAAAGVKSAGEAVSSVAASVSSGQAMTSVSAAASSGYDTVAAWTAAGAAAISSAIQPDAAGEGDGAPHTTQSAGTGLP